MERDIVHRANELLSFFMKLEGDCSSLAVTADTFPILPSDLRQTSTLYYIVYVCVCIVRNRLLYEKTSSLMAGVLRFTDRPSAFTRYFVSPVC